MLNPRSSRSRISVLIGAFLAAVFMTGGHCGNEITAPSATPTPAPSPTPTPIPASVDAYVDSYGVIPFEAYYPRDGASVQVKQVMNTQTCVTDATGHCIVSGLAAGQSATVGATFGDRSAHKVLTLAPGVNHVEIRLPD
jgi:hypothetical protein